MNDMQKLGLFLAKMALRLKQVEDGLQNAGGSTTPEPEEPHSKFYRYAKAVDTARESDSTFYRYAAIPESLDHGTNATFYRYAPLADGARTVAVTFYRYAPLVDSSIKS